MKIATRESIETRDMSDGQWRLWLFVDAVRRGAAPDPGDISALADAFREILAGVDPKKALGIEGKPHQGRSELDRGGTLHRGSYARADGSCSAMTEQRAAGNR
jgi:hypothetical protein